MSADSRYMTVCVHLTALPRYPQVVRCLLTAGVDTTIIDDYGRDVLTLLNEISTPVTAKIRQLIQGRSRRLGAHYCMKHQTAAVSMSHIVCTVYTCNIIMSR